jgi:Tfp pilus assembly protein PilV
VTRVDTRRAERGTTILEVMIATTILAIAAAGFAGTSNYAASATRIGHRRTTQTLIRGGLIDRMNVTPRAVLRDVAAANEGTWLVDACYEQGGALTASNGAYAAGFECPEFTYYRSWIRVTDNGADAWARTTDAWSVGIYVERTDPGCDADLRDASIACLSADLLLTD